MARRPRLDQRYMVLDDRSHFAHMDLRLPAHPRHVAIDLDDQALASPCGGRGEIVVRAQREEATPVHRRDRHDEGVERDDLLEQAGDLAEVDGNEAQELLAGLELPLDDLVIGAADEEVVGVDLLDDILGQQRLGQRLHGNLVIEPNLLEVVGPQPVGKRRQQGRRLADRHAEGNRGTIGNARNCVRGSRQLGHVQVSIACRHRSIPRLAPGHVAKSLTQLSRRGDHVNTPAYTASPATQPLDQAHWKL